MGASDSCSFFKENVKMDELSEVQVSVESVLKWVFHCRATVSKIIYTSNQGSFMSHFVL